MADKIRSFLKTDAANLLVSFLVAISMFFYVSESIGPTNGGGLSNPFGRTSHLTDEKITVPVRVSYDENKYFVTGAPQEVTVTVTAGSGILKSIQSSNAASAVLDLTKLDVGTHQVDFVINGISPELVKSIDPANATVEIAESDSKTMSIDANYQRSNLAEGVTEKSFDLSESKATVVGSKTQIASVSRIVAFMDIPANTNSNVSKKVTLQAQDSSGNIVEGVQINPSTVNAKLVVNNPNDSSDEPSDDENTSAQVPITINPVNGDAGLFSIVPSLQTASVSGKDSDVSAVNSIVVTVDLSAITAGTSASYPLIADNVEIDPKNVEITVTPIN